MEALKIAATVFMGISCITAILKNNIIWQDNIEKIGVSIYGLLWRAFVIVAIWNI